MSISAMIRPRTIASISVMAEMISVICSPDIRKSKLPQTVSQRNWYLTHVLLFGRARRVGSSRAAAPVHDYGATIGSSLCFLAYFISRPSSLMVSTNRLM